MNLTRIGLSIVASVAAFPAVCSAVTPGIEHHEITAFISPDSAWLVVQDQIDIDLASLQAPDQPLRFLLHTNLVIEAAALGDTPIDWKESDRFNPKHFWDRPDYGSIGAYAHSREVEIAPPPGERWPSPARVRLRFAGAIDDTLHPPEEDYGRSFETTTGLIESRGAFLAGGTFWLPTVPDDLFTFNLTANVPEGWDAVSQGKLAEHHAVWDRRIARFECPYPMTEVYLVAGPWQQRRVRHGETDIMTYTYATDDALTGRYIDATRDYLDLYEEAIGPYPFSKFALVENFWETGYGMPSFTLLGSTVIRLPFIVYTSYGHEILHCWWGNGVFVDYERGNWCEGLTSYMADYAYKARESADAATDYRRNQLAGYLNYVSSQKDIPLTAFRERHSGATQAVGYGKSMMVFHMLRRRVGDDRFRAGIRAFYQNHEFEMATWHDLIREFEVVSGEDFTWFAAQWIERSGAPLLSLGHTSVDDTGSGLRVRGQIDQTEPTYRLRVPVAVTTQSGEVVRVEAEVDDLSSTFVVPVPEPPVSVTVDPDFDVFRRLHREEFPPVLSQTMGADSTIIVLSEAGSEPLRAAYQRLADRWGGEPGVRVVGERDISLDGLHEASVWIFGDTQFQARFQSSGPAGADAAAVVESITGDNTYPPATHTIVVTRAHPTNSDLSWSWLRLATPDVGEAIGRKVPHYGRYSYLVFEGTTNVGKGTWRIQESPMTADLSGLSAERAD